jgi:hypothetical protein
MVVTYARSFPAKMPGDASRRSGGQSTVCGHILIMIDKFSHEIVRILENRGFS